MIVDEYEMKGEVVDAMKFEDGMEDGAVFDIALFGLLDLEECIEGGFVPNFEKDRIPYISMPDGKLLVKEGDWVITTGKG